MNKKEYFIGSIINQQKKKVYHKKSEFYGNLYYKLTLANHSQQHPCFAYSNLLNQTLWSTIEKKDYQSNYLFTLHKRKWGWVLLDFRARN